MEENITKLLELLGAGGVGALGTLLVTKPVDKIGAFVKGLYERKKETEKHNQHRLHLNHVIDIEKPMQIYAGTNQLALSEGKKGMSQYLQNAGLAFSSTVKTTLSGDIAFEEVGADDNLLKIDINKELILLGGPVANLLGGKVTGYKYDQLPNGAMFPTFNSNNFRWGYYCGDKEHGYGSYSGEIEKAKRCEGGEIIERPQYAIIDNNSSSLQKFRKDGNGFLEEEVLLITKVPNPFRKEFSTFIIGGMHGYSINEFSSEIELNLNKLKDKIHGSDKYQVYVPVILTHENTRGVHVTIATLDWGSSQVELL